MNICKTLVRGEIWLMAATCLILTGVRPASAQPLLAQAATQQSAQTPAVARPVGTIKSISGNAITLTTGDGSDVTVQVQDTTKLVRIAPGQKDLKDAAPIQFADLQPGDRILVRGKLTDDGKSVIAISVVAMKKADIAEKQARERDEWQKHGFGGLVNSVDAASGTISIALPSQAEKKSLAVHLSNDTILRRYALDSVKFDDAKPAPLDQIKPGDQLRARGTRSADGAEFTADEIVSGTFRNIAGTIAALDASASIITVQDVVSKKPITVKITAESQLRKLPQPVAQRIAARTADLQQMISRMAPATLADFQKGDAVMVVATEGGPGIPSTVIILLGGVEPILEASPKSSPSTILSPWSLSSGGGGEAAAP
jgi:hypothetical protein